MLSFSIVFILCVMVVVLCDLSPVTLSEQDSALLYIPDDYTETEEENDNLFGTNTLSEEINTDDLIDFDAAKQAEEALEQIYNGGK